LAVANALPSISPYAAYAEAGGLMSYCGSTHEQARQAGVYTGRILKGDLAGDLPVVQASKVELVINLKTARQLKLNISRDFLARADTLIE
jgi:putative ABC transport system substrate-binding protein